MHFFDFLIKFVLINFNLMAKGSIKKNYVNEETKGPETLQLVSKIIKKDEKPASERK